MRILIVEDDAHVRSSLFDILSLEGYEVSCTSSGEEGLSCLAEVPFTVALIDLKLPVMTGMEFVRQVHCRFPHLVCLIMTSYATVETAVEAMKIGARDFLTKPIDDEKLKVALDKVFEDENLKMDPGAAPDAEKSRPSPLEGIVGDDPKMQKIYSVIKAISRTDTTILLKGESGTGKGLMAQAIHRSDPIRKNGPYIEVSCGAIPPDLLESELFGHVKGAFTSAIRDRIGRFELAHTGTILLDEIDALSTHLQVKFLRVLQQKVFEMVGDTKTKRVDVRIIAATNRNLEEEIKRSTFREDFYYRLNVISIEVPPLRERKGDIPFLVKHFLTYFNKKAQRNIKGIAKEAMKAIIDYHWPGNVRELENALERIVILSEGDIIQLHDLPEEVIRKKADLTAGPSKGDALRDILKEPEKKIILQALEQSGWNRKKAASSLNISRTTFYNKMKEHQLL